MEPSRLGSPRSARSMAVVAIQSVGAAQVDRMNLHAKGAHQPRRRDADIAEAENAAHAAAQHLVGTALVEVAPFQIVVLDEQALRGGERQPNTVSTTSRSTASTASASPRSEPTIMRWKCSASARTRPGWSVTILNGKSWRRNGSAFTRSGTTVTASGCPATPRSGPTASSAAWRNCCCSRASWCACRAVALVWFIGGAAASAQTGPGVGYDRPALTGAICRQYAAA